MKKAGTLMERPGTVHETLRNCCFPGFPPRVDSFWGRRGPHVASKFGLRASADGRAGTALLRGVRGPFPKGYSDGLIDGLTDGLIHGANHTTPFAR